MYVNNPEPWERSRYRDDRGVGVPSPGKVKNFLRVFQTGSGAHPASYPMSTGGSSPGGKADGAWSWPLTSNLCRGQENIDPLSHMPSRRSALIS
jgi:hypothetical protein